MAKVTVNTNGGFDTAFLILFLFFFFVKVSELLGSLWERIDPRLLESDLPRESMATGVMFLAAILLLLLVQRKVMSKIIGAGNYEVARAAIMAVIGALVLFVPCCVSIILGLALLAGFLAPGIPWLFALIIVITLFISFGVAGFWTGWRFGKWDFFWGIVTVLYIWGLVTVLYIGFGAGAEFFLDVASFEGALWVAGSLPGALLGARLGVASFQRGAKETEPDAEPAAS